MTIQYTTYVPRELLSNALEFGFMDGVTLERVAGDAGDGRAIVVVTDEHASAELEDQLVDTVLSLDPTGKILIHTRQLVQ